jgi:hypothetical protein
MECARRQQGRSWEVLYEKLMELGGCGTAAAAAATGAQASQHTAENN